MPADTTIRLSPIREGSVDRQSLFSLYKTSLHDCIAQTFGWDESYQQARFDTQYGDDALSLIWRGAEIAGCLALRNETPSLHVSLLLLWPTYRGEGIGREVMQMVMSQATSAGMPVTLSCFLSNQAALKFYEALNFSVTSTDEHFVNLRSAELAGRVRR
ncbi:GNAT family N-acetyltransferase [Paraburkholderia sp.]|uniref:GNAT family N-acetyltransferase n=1 Tax=Paraburkholderia sp. TaxID=1926495 RepID=UPI0026123225|nr:GNAT family N-acetyltransferase [Paraburkholderia sp.]